MPRGREHIGTAAYRALTGCHPADAVIDDDAGFDGHVLASILAVAAMEDGAVAERAGLAAADLASLLAQWFPAACGTGVAWYAQDADAVMMTQWRDLAGASLERGRHRPRLPRDRPASMGEPSVGRSRPAGPFELSRLPSRHFAQSPPRLGMR
jgi:hypothetical protein